MNLPKPAVKYTDEFLRIAEHVQKTGEYLLNIKNVWKRLNIFRFPYLLEEYNKMRELIIEGGYHHPGTTKEERVLALLFLHAILSSGDSLK